MHADADRPLSHSTVAQALYLGAPRMGFAQLVEMFDAALSATASPFDDRRLTWDCDDVAIFSFGGVRVVLALTDAPGTDYAACITLSTGPDNASPDARLMRKLQGMTRMIADRLADATGPAAVLWHKVPGVVTADTVDALVWRLADADLLAFALPVTELPPSPPALRAPAEVPAQGGWLAGLFSRATPRTTARVMGATGATMAVLSLLPAFRSL